jgi:60 kDa SS-A/Ro ribonucleoprotein
MFTKLVTQMNKDGPVNSCGRPTHIVSDLEFFKRFLMLGSESGTYYITKVNLTEQHFECLDRLINDPSKHDDILNTLETYITKVYKKDYLIFALARCCIEKEHVEHRVKAYDLLHNVCYTPTLLFMFVQMYEGLHMKHHKSTGWNKLQKSFISKWYLSKDPKQLLYLVTKYRNREGWTHADVLRLAHIKVPNTVYDHIFKYITKGMEDYLMKTNKDDEITEYLKDYETLKATNDPQEAIQLVKKCNFVREHIPTTLLGNADVWNELAQNIPMIALLRNLNKLTSTGVFEEYPLTKAKVLSTLVSREIIQKSKVHPLQVLIALQTYSKGQGFKGSGTWTPDKDICAALNSAFKNAFDNIVPTDQRYLLALDISGSMTYGSVCGIESMSASEVACAMSMIIAGTEKNCDIRGFSSSFIPLNVDPNLSLEENLKETEGRTFGHTDCSLPMTWSIQNDKHYDVMIVITDNETNANTIKPSVALQQYREKMNSKCKMIVIATSANKFTIADPADPYGMLDIAGFDASTPNVIRDFVLGQS